MPSDTTFSRDSVNLKDGLIRKGEAWQIAQRRIYLDQNTLLAKNLTVFF